MEKKDVPQDHGIFGQWHAICYVTDENGEYVRTTSSGWEPTNIANGIAWEFINEELAEVVEKVRKAELSPLAYHMKKHLMDVKMLSRYTGFTSWRVKRHLKHRVFEGLDDATLQRYAAVFNITPEQMKDVP